MNFQVLFREIIHTFEDDVLLYTFFVILYVNMFVAGIPEVAGKQ